ncbi:hypothetical protein FBZ89_109213 [Nitrospirillum amazonense]|uniref:Uncharacterized protein n=1 Tax=Nitrospirillum amazonense TaxID=28077 RepID=A0A560FB36_9PROT|nr:hypothetical protein [Nitrospirillum amazonense]TWB18827.1 hypothetical protein FBZ89_109213 [Nitrospirillum amazonense]
MALPTTPPSQARTTRVSALVSEEESSTITAKASAAGLSVSAYLRLRALDDNSGVPAHALAQVDRLIAGMEADLDAAMAALDATLHRLDIAQPAPWDVA